MRRKGIIFLSVILFFITIPSPSQQFPRVVPIFEGLKKSHLLFYEDVKNGNEQEEMGEFLQRFQQIYGRIECKKLEESSIEQLKDNDTIIITLYPKSDFLPKVKDKLPIKMEQDRVIIGKQAYKGEIGLAFVCPNPFNGEKILTLLTATSLKTLSFVLEFSNHFQDPVEYVVYTITPEGHPLKLAGGIFDKEAHPRWKTYIDSIPISRVGIKREEKGNIGWARTIISCFPQDALIVYGTNGSERENKYLRVQASIFQKDMSLWALNPECPIMVHIESKADREVTPEELRQKNLIFIGTISSNAVLSQIKDKLPLGLGNGFIRGISNTYKEEKVGVVTAYPNPFNSDRLILIYSGATFKGINCYSYAWMSEYDYAVFLNPPPIQYTRKRILEVGYWEVKAY